MRLTERARERLHHLEQQGLRRFPIVSSSASGPYLTIAGRPVLNLCSNDYLGLAGDPRLRAAIGSAVKTMGVGTGGSRLVTGSRETHRALERRLAGLVGAEDTITFSSGYAAAIGALGAAIDRDDVVFSDELNHASLIDGIRLSRATTFVYPHRSIDVLESMLRAHRARYRDAFVITDGLFSMDGDVADVAALRNVTLELDANLVVDEAHALGVLGPSGAGLCRAAGVAPDLLLGTLGKAFGISGAFAAGAQPVIELLRNRARSYVFSTAPPAILADVALMAVELAERAHEARTTVLEHANTLRTGLQEMGLPVISGTSHIVSVVLGDSERTMSLSRRLLDRGVFVQGIRPPTVPIGTSRLRITPMASHSLAQIELALRAFHEST